MGTRPRRSGSAKVVVPLPPKVVPSSENRAAFDAMGRSCPLHSAQPGLGAKTKLISRISPRKGSAIEVSLGSRAVDHGLTGSVHEAVVVNVPVLVAPVVLLRATRYVSMLPPA